MDIRELSFKVLPADCIAVDTLVHVLGIPESAAARFIFAAGLLYLEDVKVSQLPESYNEVTQLSLARQDGQLGGLSDYGLERADQVEEVYPSEELPRVRT